MTQLGCDAKHAPQKNKIIEYSIDTYYKKNY